MSIFAQIIFIMKKSGLMVWGDTVNYIYDEESYPTTATASQGD